VKPTINRGTIAPPPDRGGSVDPRRLPREHMNDPLTGNRLVPTTRGEGPLTTRLSRWPAALEQLLWGRELSLLGAAEGNRYLGIAVALQRCDFLSFWLSKTRSFFRPGYITSFMSEILLLVK
jgi:hypothetical protein